jgi:hypothetical protein
VGTVIRAEQFSGKFTINQNHKPIDRSMKHIIHRYAWTVGLLAAIGPVLAQGFVSGSNGSYGPLNVTADVTLDPPADGIFHCTTINLAQGATLRFNRNPLNTPIYLLATGDVAINGNIDVSGQRGSDSSPAPGRGGPGGFDGGVRNTAPDAPSGAGRGPGGGLGGEFDTLGAGSYGGRNGLRTGNGSVYGTPILIPLVGGSGGGGYLDRSGGGGGGAVLIASSTSITLNASGRIQSSGGFTGMDFNGGSGGAIRLVAPIVSGTGSLSVYGGSTYVGSGNAGHGRARIDAIDRSAMAISCQPASAFSSGNLMLVLPQTASRLDVIHVAGTNIPENTGAPVQIQLPLGAPAEQTVRVQARDFGAAVPVRVVLTPESGDPVSYDATIDNAANNPATIDIPATFPVNTVVSVDVWTR